MNNINDPKADLSKVSSKIKTILIDLRNYTFFHRPTDEFKADRRFIGRERVREKLKAILTDSEAKSGAYLITGFRGMGKTSVVNKVLAELRGNPNRNKVLLNWSRIFLFLLFVSFLNTEGFIILFTKSLTTNSWVKNLPNLFFLFTVFYLLPTYLLHYSFQYFKNFRDDFGLKGNGDDTDYFAPLFIKTNPSVPKNIYWRVTKDYLIASYIHLFALLILFFIFSPNQSVSSEGISFAYSDKFKAYLLSYLLFAAYSYFSNTELIKKNSAFLNIISLFFLVISLSKFIFSQLLISLNPQFEQNLEDYRWTDTGSLFFGILLLSFYCFHKKNETSSDYGKLYRIIIGFSIFFFLRFALSLICPNTILHSYIIIVFLITLVIPFTVLRKSDFFKIREDVVKFFNYSHIQSIKINLGQDNLKEDDILKLIAKSIYEKYRKIVRPSASVRRFIWQLVWFLVVYYLAIIFFYYKPTYSIINELRRDLYITELFPSQSVLATGKVTYEDDRELMITIEKVESALDKQGVKNFGTGNYFEIIYAGDVDYGYSFLQTVDPEFKFHNSVYANFDAQRFAASPLPYRFPEKLVNLYPITVRIDYFLYEIYTDFSHFITDVFSKKSLGVKKKNDDNLEVSLLNRTLDLHENFHFIPPRIDYFLLIYLIIFFTAANLIYRTRLFGVSHKAVMRELRYLIEDIDASVTDERGGNAGVEKYFGIFRKRSRTYTVTTAREIETRLISILAMSNKIAPYRMRPKFVFVFDELDKIEPHREYTGDENDSASSLDTFFAEGTKKRQEAIGKILSNLKHFFNTADAKFIFIAGREMYDAALADISDRDSLIGSLFHDVIYVNSFFKDPSDNRLTDVTSMTEQYVCQFLMPKEWLSEKNSDKNLNEIYGYDLRTFYRYLTEKHTELSTEAKFKVVISLKNFITYLTYRSNGAPKKITKIFEEYIVRISNGLSDASGIARYEHLKHRELLVSDCKSSLHLRFSYYDQYVFGFSSYLFNPFLLAVSKYLRDFGDKLLVSTSFLLNHMYKFHNTGFSFRTLELTPEIIAINKAPELRGFIDRLLHFLDNTHIREIISGLHQFKFNSRIEKEISFISKISEKESAAYNFTLDESWEIKRIYKKRLQQLRKENIAHEGFSYSEAYLNLILGDLYYHDQEYDQAVIQYKDATKYLRLQDSSDFKLDYLVFYVRAELKLGITQEKKRNFDDAILIYENLRKRIEDFVTVNEAADNKSSKHSVTKIETTKVTLLGKNKTIAKDNDELYRHLASDLTPGLRLFYQPLIAVLHTIEKHTVKSLTGKTIKDNVAKFKMLVDERLEKSQSFLIKAEYYDKIGDILFYKNGLLAGEKYYPQFDRGSYFGTISMKTKDSDGKVRDNIKRYLRLQPLTAYQYYMFSISTLINHGIEGRSERIRYYDYKKPEISEKVIVHYFTYFLFLQPGNEKEIQKRKSFYHASGNALSDAADCILSTLKHDHNTREYYDTDKLKGLLHLDFQGKKAIWSEASYWENLLSENTRIDKNLPFDAILKNEFVRKIDNEYENYTRFEIAVRYIYIASVMYLWAGEHAEHSFQISKILSLIKTIIQLDNNNTGSNSANSEKLLQILEDVVVYRGIRSIYRSYENNNESERRKLMRLFNINGNTANSKSKDIHRNLETMINTSTSAGEDVKELLILYKEIELELSQVCRNNEIKLDTIFVTPFSQVTGKHARLSELRYKARYNRKVYDCIFAEENSRLVLTMNGNSVDRNEARKFLITDSIFCYYEILKSLNIYGLSYIHNHSQLADCFERMSYWLEEFESQTDHAEYLQEFEYLMGIDEVEDFSVYSIREKAIDHYYKVIEMHSEGGEYKETIEKMFYLDDNFNDNMYHFCATLERFKINSGFVNQSIINLENNTTDDVAKNKEEDKKQSMYSIDAYFRKAR